MSQQWFEDVVCDVHGCIDQCDFDPWEIPSESHADDEAEDVSLASWDDVLKDDGRGKEKASLALELFLEQEKDGRLSINRGVDWPCGNYTEAAKILFEIDPKEHSTNKLGEKPLATQGVKELIVEEAARRIVRFGAEVLGETWDHEYWRELAEDRFGSPNKKVKHRKNGK